MSPVHNVARSRVQHLHVTRYVIIVLVIFKLLYNRLKPYTGRSQHRTVPVGTLRYEHTGRIQYGP